MYETLFRRLSPKHLKDWGTPDLILIDGGTQQVNAALSAQAERETHIPIIGVAKREEELIIKIDGSAIDVSKLITSEHFTVQNTDGFMSVNLHPGLFKTSGHSISLRGSTKNYKYDDVIKLIQRIRDESHRFAVTYHSILRSKQQTASVLDGIPGIGPATRKKLIKQFGSTRGIMQAPDEELELALGIKKATALKQQLRSTQPFSE
jgi:excinuclease ABC subunit C